MPDILLDIDDKEAKELLEFFLLKKQQFIADNMEILDKIKDYDYTINKLKSIISSPRVVTYPQNGSWNQKIQYFLNDESIWLTAREITKEIMKIEGRVGQEEERKIYGGVAATLSSNNNVLYLRKNNERNEYVYSIKK